MQEESEKHKNPYYDRKMICKLIYQESLSFHPENEEATPSKEVITELPVKEPKLESPKKLPSLTKRSPQNEGEGAKQLLQKRTLKEREGDKENEASQSEGEVEEPPTKV